MLGARALGWLTTMTIEIKHEGKTVAVVATKAKQITSDYLVGLAKRYNEGKCGTFTNNLGR